MNSIKSNDQWLYIRNNTPDPIGLTNISEYSKNLSPILESYFFTPSKLIEITNKSKEEIISEINVIYKQLIQEKLYFPGRYGDWIKISLIDIDNKKLLNINFIGQSAWIKPTLAADLGIFVKSTNSLYFIGIERKNEPGKGKPALVGGILHCKAFLESPLYSIIREANEECNLQVEYTMDPNLLKENYMIQEIPVVVKGFEIIHPSLKEIKSKISFIKTIPTPEIERNIDGTKRVYITSAYVIVIDLNKFNINEDILKKIFRAGDDASNLVIRNVTKLFTNPSLINPTLNDFGLSHHIDLIEEMLFFLQKKLKF